MKAKEKVEKEITSVRQSQEAEAASNYRNEPQDCNRLRRNKNKTKSSGETTLRAATENNMW